MKCEQCNNKATDSGSGLCKNCEDELIEEIRKQQEEDLEEYYAELKRGMY